ncbi:MAG: NAD(P)H-dependent oxidoreductase [Deltaproteobacteria bacterium]|nr:NAD(P)H-dependent oxidoreductase [Deltaproteobacteria bacterium]
MKVLAVNSSARVGRESKTERMLLPLVEGMRDAGAEVEMVNLAREDVAYCIGCFTCWTKTPGTCIHKDDMTREIYPRYIASDMCILATPLYHYTVNACMKTFIERTLPMALPFMVHQDGVTRHPMRHQARPTVVLSVAGFPDMNVFDQLSAYVKFLFHDKLMAEIYRPAAESMEGGAEKAVVEDILEATFQGGRELVASGSISADTMARIQQPVMDIETMVPLANIFWQTCIDEGVTPKTFEKKEMVPRPDSIETFLMVMKMAFNPEKAKDITARIQFFFSGEVAGPCYLQLDAGKIEVFEHTSDAPDLTIETPFDVWMDILTQKADGEKLFMEQKYQVSGDMGLLMRFAEFFGR